MIRHQLIPLFFDKHLSTPASLSNNIEKSCHMTAFFVILRQISTAFDIQCKKCCRMPLDYVKNYCRKKLLSNFMIRHHFQTAFFDKKFCRKMRSKNFVEKWGRKMLSKEADIICRKIPSKNIVEKYRQKMFVNKLTTKFVKLIF